MIECDESGIAIPKWFSPWLLLCTVCPGGNMCRYRNIRAYYRSKDGTRTAIIHSYQLVGGLLPLAGPAPNIWGSCGEIFIAKLIRSHYHPH